MKQLRGQPLLTFVAVPLIIILGACIAVLVGAWSSMSTAARATTAATGIGATGTLLLALATLKTVLQNEKLVEAREREKEQPLVKHEIEIFLDPAISRIEYNIDKLNEDKQINWVSYSYERQSNAWIGSRDTTDPSLLTPLANVYIASRINEKSPDIWESITEHDAFLKALDKKGDEISSNLDGPLRDLVKELEVESQISDESDYRVLKGVIFRRLDQYGENHDHFEVWENHREEFLALFESEIENDVQEINELEGKYLDHCKELLSQLNERKVLLQDEYGVVADQSDDSIFD